MKRLIFGLAAAYFAISFIGMEANPAEWSPATRSALVLVMAVGFTLRALAPKKRIRK